MKMSEVKPGMRLRSTFDYDLGTGREFINVTELTERGFKYSLDADIPLGPRYGVWLKDGNEHFGFNGESYYEPVSLWHRIAAWFYIRFVRVKCRVFYR